MMRQEVYLIFALLTIFVSCDVVVGEEGVAMDATTGERIEGVTVLMSADEGTTKTSSTNQQGYFNTIEIVNCGFKCPEEYSLTFEKKGYSSVTLVDSDFRSAEFLNNDLKDTLIVKLEPN